MGEVFIKSKDDMNRPMNENDVHAVNTYPVSHRIRELCAEYARKGYLVANGGVRYSNISEGTSRIFTCSPYRLWEYSSFLRALDLSATHTVLDVGGACSPLVFFIAENGVECLTVDIQDDLVAMTNGIARKRSIPLKAICADILQHADVSSQRYEAVTCVSVLEHIRPDVRADFVRAMSKLVRAGGLLYITFDYGLYEERNDYSICGDMPALACGSISDIAHICAYAEDAGFAFVGNDPRSLSAAVLAQQSAPDWKNVNRQIASTSGPFDSNTPWREIAKFIVKRVFRITRSNNCRFAHHNFFRMFLKKL